MSSEGREGGRDSEGGVVWKVQNGREGEGEGMYDSVRWRVVVVRELLFLETSVTCVAIRGHRSEVRQLKSYHTKGHFEKLHLLFEGTALLEQKIDNRDALHWTITLPYRQTQRTATPYYGKKWRLQYNH